MKKWLFLIVAILMFTGCGATKEDIVIKDVLLYQEIIEAPDALGNEGFSGQRTYYYDKDGKIIATTSTGLLDVINVLLENVSMINYGSEYEEVMYNDDGTVKSITGYDSVGKRLKEYVAEFYYDENGRKTRVDYLEDQGFGSITSFLYDENGRLTSVEVTESASGYVYPKVEKKEIKYDENGHQVNRANYQLNEELETFYDSTDRIIKEVYPNGTTITWVYGDFNVSEE